MQKALLMNNSFCDIAALFIELYFFPIFNINIIIFIKFRSLRYTNKYHKLHLISMCLLCISTNTIFLQKNGFAACRSTIQKHYWLFLSYQLRSLQFWIGGLLRERYLEMRITQGKTRPGLFPPQPQKWSFPETKRI